MKEFTCSYRAADGGKSDAQPKEKIKATNAEEAAKRYAELFPSDAPQIDVVNFVSGRARLNNPLLETQWQEAQRAQAQQEAALGAARLESLKALATTVKNTNGNLEDLSYADLTTLIENMRDFREIREELGAEECTVRERLYMKASFDSNLQALLQTEQMKLQTSLLKQIASGQPTASAAGPGKSNLAQNAAMLGGVATLQKLNQIEENTEEVSEGFGFD